MSDPSNGLHADFQWTALVQTIARGVALTMAFLIALSLAGQVCFVLNIDLNESLVEWMQFVVLMGGAVLLTVRPGAKGRWLRILVALGFFVLAMEEIDWAQPYLGYAPLPVLADHNAYSEMALHNSFGLEHVLRKLVVLGGMAASALLLISVVFSHGWNGLSRYARRFLVWPGSLCVSAILVMLVGRMIHPGQYFGFDEFGELAAYSGAVWFALSRPLAGLSLPGWRQTAHA